MNTTLADQIINNMRQKPTEELLAIWTTNDRGQWSDPAFKAVYQTLEERGVTAPPQVVAVPPLPRYRGVSGWLLLFCISLTVLNPMATIVRLGANLEFVSKLSDIYPSLRTASIIDGILSVTVNAFSIYAGICLWRVSSGAVKKAQTLLLCQLVYAAIVAFLPLMVGLPISANDATIFATIKSIVPAVRGCPARS
jgi:hypothetical protein